MVEFALILPLLLLLLLGMVDFGKAFNHWTDMTHLANTGARWAAVNTNPGGSTLTLQEKIRADAATRDLRSGGSSSLPSAAQVCVSFPDTTSNPGDPVKVTVTATYHFLTFVGSRTDVATKTIEGSATMRLEQKPTKYSAGCA